MSELLPLLQDICSRLANIEANLGLSQDSSAKAGGAATPTLPRSIRAFDEYVTEKLEPFVAICDKLGGDAATAGQLVKAAWLEMRSFLLLASACKEPPQAQLPTLLAGVAAKIRELGSSVKRNEWEKHSKTCSEGVQALNWLVIKPAPRDYIENFIGGSDYWANGIRREFKTTNPDQVAFCDTFKALLSALMDYVKEYHTTGASWNPRGVDVSEYKASGTSLGVPVAAPTPVTVPTVASATAPASRAPAPAPSANMFAELNKGGAITSGLKTVTKDMQTWRSEYKGGDAPAPVVVAPKKAPTANASSQVRGPPKLEFQAAGNKWCVENQTEAGGVVEVTINDLKETVYIFGCVGATINIAGKCKSIIADSCKKTKVLFDNAFASCEIVNCQRMQVQCRVAVGSVAIDKTDGIIVFLPESSLDSKIVASKSSEMNLSWPDPDGSGNLIERPIPEQYVHQITASRTGVTADVSELYTH